MELGKRREYRKTLLSQKFRLKSFIFSAFVTLLAIVTVLSVPVYAQNEDESITEPTTSQNSSNSIPSDPFKVDIELGTQSIFDNSVPLTVVFTPQADFSNVGIAWDSSDGYIIKNNFKNYFPVKNGQEYRYNATMSPTKKGTYNVTVEITAWDKSNYTSSKSYQIAFDNSLLITPMQSGYSTQLIIVVIVAIALLVGLFFVLRPIAKKLGQRFKNWIKPPKI